MKHTESVHPFWEFAIHFQIWESLEDLHARISNASICCRRYLLRAYTWRQVCRLTTGLRNSTMEQRDNSNGRNDSSKIEIRRLRKGHGEYLFVMLEEPARKAEHMKIEIIVFQASNGFAY